jgi:hypothetical protein
MEPHSLSLAQARQSWRVSSQTGVAVGQLVLARQTEQTCSTQTGVAPPQSSSPSQTPAELVHALWTQAPSGQGCGLLAPTTAHSAGVTQQPVASSSPMSAGRGKPHALARTAVIAVRAATMSFERFQSSMVCAFGQRSAWLREVSEDARRVT